MADDDDFYEDDEPILKIKALRARPYGLVTAPPAPRAVTFNLFPMCGEDWRSLRSSSQGEPACR